LALQYLSAGDAKDYALVVMPMALRPGILILGVLVSLIQAVVFTGLSMVYIGGAIAVHEEHEHSAEDGAAAHHEAHAA
jgi:F0F1-type ATP synthase membrane subunit a